jgi:hypothetical protein
MQPAYCNVNQVGRSFACPPVIFGTTQPGALQKEEEEEEEEKKSKVIYTVVVE